MIPEEHDWPPQDRLRLFFVLSGRDKMEVFGIYLPRTEDLQYVGLRY